jgi:hypothetical protein
LGDERDHRNTAMSAALTAAAGLSVRLGGVAVAAGAMAVAGRAVRNGRCRESECKRASKSSQS